MSTATPYLSGRSVGVGIPVGAAARVARAAGEAAAVRAHLRDPDVVAWRVERVRTVVDRLIWTGMVAGLLFTMANVQQFAAAGAPAWSARWCIAWLLDPTVSLVLLGVLFAERLTAREQIPAGPWTRCGKWALLGATYVMNTWASWQAGDAAGVVLHSVPPLVVFVAAEAISELHDKLTECVHRAYTTALARAERDNAEQDKAGTAAATAGHTGGDQPRQDASVTTGRQAGRAPVAPGPGVTVAPAPTTTATTGRPTADAPAPTGRRPRVSPTTTTTTATTAMTATTARAAGRGRRATPELAVLVAAARPLLDRDPELGRRELAHRLGEVLAVEVAPYWAAKAKADLEAQRRLHVVGGDR